MVELLRDYHLYILVACGCFNIMLALFGIAIKFKSVKRKISLIKIEVCSAVNLFADVLTFVYKGDSSSNAYWIIRVAQFLTFAMLLALLFFLSEYTTALFMETGNFKTVPNSLKAGFIIPITGFVLLIISQFTGIYYYFDENNVYYRGSLFWLSFVLPFVTTIILFYFVMKYRKLITNRITFVIAAFSILPFVAGAVQIFVPDLSLINLSGWIGSVVLFFFALRTINAELSKAASSDYVTGLPNALGFMYEIDKHKHFGNITDYNAFYFDIAQMRRLNNKYGRAVGDQIIREYAFTIKRALEKDEVVGRLGGNFFVALVKKKNTEAFMELLKDTVVEVQMNNKSEGIHVHAIAGGYSIENGDITPNLIMSNISTAVTYAKNAAHVPCVFMNETLQQEFRRIHRLEEDIKLAFENKEFIAFYQPKVDSRESCICGAEALARWNKDGELVPLNDFLPLMESNGSITELDFYILDYVCKEIKGWIAKGLKPVTVSINFSRKHLGDADFADRILDIILENEVPKHLIQVEITETLDDYPLSLMLNAVTTLQRRGISVAIDDFGTGTASVSLLKDVHFDILKIDKCFIDYENEKDKQLLQDIITMAEHAGVKVIAEGVEEMVKVKELADMGCYMIQGYAYDKPMDNSLFEYILKERKY